MEEDKGKLAELGASLIIWLIVLVILLLFTQGWVFFIIKSLMIILFIFGVRDWVIDYHLLLAQHKLDKGKD